MKLHHDLLLGMEKQKVTVLIGLDLSAAFDTVDHKILKETLKNMYGVDGDALLWFSSYLSDRSYYVFVQDTASIEQHMNFSVPQGSFLGQVLYSVYASPLGDVISE